MQNPAPGGPPSRYCGAQPAARGGRGPVPGSRSPRRRHGPSRYSLHFPGGRGVRRRRLRRGRAGRGAAERGRRAPASRRSGPGGRRHPRRGCGMRRDVGAAPALPPPAPPAQLRLPGAARHCRRPSPASGRGAPGAAAAAGVRGGPAQSRSRCAVPGAGREGGVADAAAPYRGQDGPPLGTTEGPHTGHCPGSSLPLCRGLRAPGTQP